MHGLQWFFTFLAVNAPDMIVNKPLLPEKWPNFFLFNY